MSSALVEAKECRLVLVGSPPGQSREVTRILEARATSGRTGLVLNRIPQVVVTRI